MPGSVGRSSGEIYLDILSRLAPGAACDRVMPADADAALPQGMALAEVRRGVPQVRGARGGSWGMSCFRFPRPACCPNRP